MIESSIGNLLDYGVKHSLIEPVDRVYVRNRIIEVLELDDYDLALETADCGDTPVDELLAPVLDDAVARGLIEPDTVTQRDLWDTAVMGTFVLHPSVVVERFWALHAQSPVAATDYFHHLSASSNYIRIPRTDKNITWPQHTRYGQLDITINVSKPEKDPRDIAKAARGVRAKAHAKYPANLLARDNEGYPGRTDHPARQNLRLIPMELDGDPWLLQYSPYRYYPQHAIALSEAVTPMRINQATFTRLADFVELFPHYFMGSNADLPIVGGSILSHDHFQGGAYEFALDRAAIDAAWDVDGTSVEVVHWPLTDIRLRGERSAVLDRATELLDVWRGYSDEERGVLAFTGDTPHNTITPIARQVGSHLQLDLVLRNNRTSPQHPDGIYHPHVEIHPIKRENIGLIEVLGLAVLPGRLAVELNEIALALANGTELPADLSPHQAMLDELRGEHPGRVTLTEALELVRDAAGEYFVRGLEHCGVFGPNAVAGCTRLLASMGWIRS